MFCFWGWGIFMYISNKPLVIFTNSVANITKVAANLHFASMSSRPSYSRE